MDGQRAPHGLMLAGLGKWSARDNLYDDYRRVAFVARKKEVALAAAEVSLTPLFSLGIDGTYRDAMLVSHRWRVDLENTGVPVLGCHEATVALVRISPTREFSNLTSRCKRRCTTGAGYHLLGSQGIASQVMVRRCCLSVPE